MTTPTCHSPGFSEAIVSVSDLGSWIEFFESVFEWTVVHRGKADPRQALAWNLEDGTSIEEVVVREPNADTTLGAVRLVKIKSSNQDYARPNAYAWDTGGFFDLHVQVRDVRSLFAKMQSRGWHGYTPVKRIDVSGVILDEVLIHGPDGMAFALIERVSPPFEVVEGYKTVSPAWNAPQMVTDFVAVHRFYSDGLGFKPTIETEMPPAPDGDNLYGLPLNVAKDTTTQLAFFHPGGERGAMGSVDLLRLAGLKGRDLSQSTRPPHLGLVLLRFPVKGVETYYTGVKQTGVNIVAPLQDLTIEPIGPARLFTVRSPEGAWLDFFEAV